MKRVLILMVGLMALSPHPEARAELVTETVTTTQEQVVTVETLAPMVMSQTKDVTAKFISLTPQAVQLGLSDAMLVGKLEYEKLPDNSTRTKIAWHSLAISTGSGSMLSEPLPPPLESQFLSKAEREEPGTQLAARGNLDIVTQKFLLLKEKAGKDKQPKTLVTEAAEKEEEKRDNKADDLTPTSSGPSSGGGAAPNNSDADDFKANLITTSWEPCAVRIAAAESRVYQQHRPVDKDDTGAVVDSGGCVDTGVFYDAAKVYGGTCAVVTDYVNRKVYEQFREVATVEGNEVVVRECTTDFNKFSEIKATVTGKDLTCGYRHDFVGRRSIEQEILYYTNGTETIELTACQDSDRAYAQFETELTCSYIIDGAQSLAFKQTRIGFTDASGGTVFATECRPIEGDDGRTIEEEFCDPKYEHDFVNHVSYYRTRSYYIDPDNNLPAYVTPCGRSASNAFPHSFTTSSCSLTNDDAKLQTQYFALTKIETIQDGVITIAPCEPYGAPVAYVRTTDKQNTVEFTTSGSWAVPSSVSSISLTLVGAGQAGETGKQPEASTADGGAGGRGGGPGQIKEGVSVLVTTGATYPVTIGASSGASSSFGSILTALGGTGYTSGGAGGAVVYNGTIGAYTIGYPGNPGAAGAASASGGAGGAGGGGGQPWNGGANGSAPGGSGGGGGAGGYGSIKLAGGGSTGGRSQSYNCASDPYNTGGAGGAGGSGYGAGGGGGGGGAAAAPLWWIYYSCGNYSGAGGAGGAGAPGYAKIIYPTPQYLRGDGTTYAP